jgi:biopolymer transport protein ExbD
VTIGELEATSARTESVDAGFPVIVKGDSNVQYQKVIDILDLLRRSISRKSVW